MQNVMNIGEINWTVQDIKNSIPEFLNLYKNKPIDYNKGGMRSPHMFATWFMLKKLNPVNVIESGVWKGQGTWLLENTLPNSNFYCIDINLNSREYISNSAKYFEKDFTKIDWSFLTNKENTLLFFDDHQNAFDRLKKGKDFGFKHFIFEDNYPASQGDCYSLKKAFQHAGFKHKLKFHPIGIVSNMLKQSKTNKSVKPNKNDSDYLVENLEIYYKFPPLFKKEFTRWGDEWNEEKYPTPKPIFTSNEISSFTPFFKEAEYYTWICYAKLK